MPLHVFARRRCVKAPAAGDAEAKRAAAAEAKRAAAAAAAAKKPAAAADAGTRPSTSLSRPPRTYAQIRLDADEEEEEARRRTQEAEDAKADEKSKKKKKKKSKATTSATSATASVAAEDESSLCRKNARLERSRPKAIEVNVLSMRENESAWFAKRDQIFRKWIERERDAGLSLTSAMTAQGGNNALLQCEPDLDAIIIVAESKGGMLAEVDDRAPTLVPAGEFLMRSSDILGFAFCTTVDWIDEAKGKQVAFEVEYLMAFELYQGIGSKIMTKAVSLAKSSGFERVVLSSLNSALDFYMKNYHFTIMETKEQDKVKNETWLELYL